ncbi:TPA: hypothetical protein DF272_01940 [Candidatus Falkowbacteria bacterium]|nr:hypothetical protein [Candidatus Falkowbacteria bacterium]
MNLTGITRIIGSGLSRILNLFRFRYPKTVLVVFVGLILSSFVVAGFVFAAGGTVDSILQFLGKILSYLAYGIAYILSLLVSQIFVLLIVASSYDNFFNEAVNKGWVIIRDLVNMGLVIILLVYAFGMIFRMEDKVGGNKALAKIILVAVLINFSKLAAALMIDIAQVFMMTFVNGYAATAGGNLIQGIGMAQYFDFATNSAGETTDWIKLLGMLAFTIVFLIFTGIITFMLVIVLLTRIVMLWILIILSPIGFLNFIGFKGISTYTQMWWSEFSKAVIVGPVVAFFLWLSLLMMSDAQNNFNTPKIEEQAALTTSGQAGGVGRTQHPLENLEMFIPAVMSLAMLYGSYKITQKIGGAVAGGAGRWAYAKGQKYAGAQSWKKGGFLNKGTRSVGRFTAKKVAPVLASRPVKALAGLAGGAGGAVLGGVRSLARIPENIFRGGAKGFREGFESFAPAAGGVGKGRRLAQNVLAGVVGGVGALGGALGYGVVQTVGSGVYRGTGGAYSRTGKLIDHATSKLALDDIAKYDKKLEKYKGDDPQGKATLRQTMRNEGRTMEERAAAMRILGQQGDLGGADAEDVKAIRRAFSSRKGVMTGLKLGDSLKHLEYDLTTEEGKDQFKTAIKNKKIDVSKLDSSALDDTVVVEAMQDALGNKGFTQKLQVMVENNPQAKDRVVQTLEARINAAGTSNADKSRMRQGQAKVAKSFNITVDGPGGTKVTKNVFAGSGLSPQQQAHEMAQFVGSVKGEDLAKIPAAELSALDPDQLQAFLSSVSREQLGNIASEFGPGEAENMIAQLQAQFTAMSATPPAAGSAAARRFSRMSNNMEEMALDPRLMGTEFDNLRSGAAQTIINNKIADLTARRSVAGLTTAQIEDIDDDIVAYNKKLTKLRTM